MNVGPVLQPAGAEAIRDAPLIWGLLIGGSVVFAALMVLLARAVAGAPREAPPGRWVVGGGLLLPIAVVVALQALNLRHLSPPAPPPGDALLVGVGGHLWWWSLRLPGPDGEIVLANELHLPVGRAVRLGLSSDNVIHSLWVPALAGKVDLVPGRVNQLELQAVQEGEWPAPCSEFCGTQHTRMTLHVVARQPAEFDAWLAAQALPAREPRTPLQQRGRDAFVALGCGTCHGVRGVPGVSAANDAGPDLTHLASRRYLGAGSLANDEAGLRAWVSDVQRLKPGARMPSYAQLDSQTLDALVAWLGSLE